MKTFQHAFVICSLLLVNLACKKDHNCECTVLDETVTTVYKELSTSDAEAQCASQNDEYKSEGGSCELN